MVAVMTMRFSEEEVYVYGLAFALVVSALVGIPYCRISLKKYWNQKRANSLNDLIVITIFELLCAAMLFSMFRTLLNFSSLA